MDDEAAFLDRIRQLSPTKLALLALDLQAELEAARNPRRVPVAVIGIGCRMPGGVADPEALWELLRQGTDAIQEVPADRWDIDAYYDADPLAPGKMSSRWGGFVGDVSVFDPQFFGIAPREAASLDPQQRLLLEVAWETLEHAGRSADSLNGSRTGVFLGLASSDYFQKLMRGDTREFDAYLATGVSHSVAAGRLSYLFGFSGPAVTVDTACSSSLLAVHLACQSLQARECDLALAGGVNVILLPEATIAMSKSHMMAPDGRCKAFDARADGFVRAEGCGLVALKRLDDAIADGDRVLSVILGSATNQDGRSNGLTAPSGMAQRSVIRAALASAGVAPADVGYVEAHGTGTSLGDPIEVEAIGEALGEGRDPSQPVVIGALKANLGHLEGAAGIAGFIKASLVLRHGVIPRQLHFDTPNPYIDWDRLPVTVPTSHVAWPDGYARRIAGVSSFGFSGSNVHVVLAEPPLPVVAPATASGPQLLCLSADEPATLAALATQFAARLGSDGASLADICFTAAVGRSHRPQRLAVVADSVDSMRAGLRAGGTEHPGVVRGIVRPASPARVAFLFTGQGAQYAGMGRRLYDAHPLFREQLARCDRVLQPLLGRSVVELLFDSSEGSDLLRQTQYAQPATFALEYALASLWRSWGVEPVAMMGHSLGEYVACCVGGVLSLEDSLALVVERGRLSMKLPENGAMVAIGIQADALRPMIGPFADRVSIAAINGPQNTVLSGEATTVRTIAQQCADQGYRTHELPISRAFHSTHVEPILDEFERFAGRLAVSAPTHQIISNVTGELAPADLGSPAYWRRHLRQPVQFAQAMETLRALDCNVFLEMGPHPVLSVLGQHCMPDGTGTWLSAMNRDRDERLVQVEVLAQLYAAGVPIDWEAYYAGSGARRVSLPTYPFRRSRHWTRADDSGRAPVRPRNPSRDGAHFFPGTRLDLATRDAVFEAELGASVLPLLADHRVHDAMIVAAPVIMEMGRAAAAVVLGGWQGGAIEDFVMLQPLVLPSAGTARVQALVSRTPDGTGAVFEVASAEPTAEGGWVRHASARVTPSRPPTSAPVSIEMVKDRLPEFLDGATYYRGLVEQGIHFGPAFQAVERVWRSEGEALAAIRTPAGLAALSATAPFHPVLLDACFQTLGAALATALKDGHADTYLMVGFDRCTLPATPTNGGWCHATLRQPVEGQDTIVGDIRLMDETGIEIATVQGLRLRRAARGALLRAAGDVNRSLYEIEWVPCGDAANAAEVPLALKAPAELAAALSPGVTALAATYDLDSYEQLVASLEKLSIRYVVEAFAELGVQFVPGATISVADLLTRGVVPRFTRLLHRLAQMLVEEGILVAAGEGRWTVVAPATALAEQVGDVRARYPRFHGEIDLLDACASALAGVLRGEQDPLQILFPAGSMTRVEALTQSSPAAQAYNSLVSTVIAAAAGAGVPGRPLRILEIGAGTGGTTVSVLAALRGRPVEYCFTDISQLFLARAADKFAGEPSMEYERLDIEQPATSRLKGRVFDVVIGANVIHATADIRQSLENIGALLAPGGLVVVLEGIVKQRWVDLTFGLTDGWWRFTDVQRRTDHPLLTGNDWGRVLGDAGFTDVARLPSSAQAVGSLARQAVIVARRGVEATKRSPDADDSRAYLIVTDDAATGRALASMLRERGAAAEVVASPAGAEAFGAVLQVSRERMGRSPTHVVHVVHDGGNQVSTAAEFDASVARATRPLLELMQAMVGGPPGGASPALWVITRGAQPGCQGTGTENLASSAAWGLGRTMANEHPEIWGGLVDIDASDATDAAQAIVSALSVQGEDQICVRQGRTHAPRLRRAALAVPAAPPAISRDGTYVVTGGIGGMGLRVAQWLADLGAGRLVLLARREPDANAQVAIERMRSAGAEVITRSVDVSDQAALTELFEELRTSQPPLRGVMHIAGIFDDRVILRQDWSRFERVLAPKVRGGWLLDRLTANLDLDFFVAFSSGASFLAPVGLANYAAANAFTDAIAHRRRLLGRPALAINWGPWENIGMAEAVGEQREQQWSSAGFSSMTAAEGLDILGRLMAGAPAQVAALDVVWDTYLGTLGREAPLYRDLAGHGAGVEDSVTVAGKSMPEELAAVPLEDRWELLLSLVAREVRHVLDFRPEDALDPDRGLFALGMDSLTAVELKNRLQRALGQPIPATAVFDYASVTALGRYLAGKVGVPLLTPGQSTRAPQPAKAEKKPELTTDELAMRLSARLRDKR